MHTYNFGQQVFFYGVFGHCVAKITLKLKLTSLI